MTRPRPMFLAIALAALAALLGLGCRPAPGGSARAGGADQPLTATDLAAVRATDSAFAAAAAAGNAASVAGNYLPDAHLLPPNSPPIEGREAIQKFWAGFLDTYQVRFTVESDEIEGHGDLAYARGHYTLDATPKAAGAPPLHDEGKFVDILRRQADGSWRYAVDMYSSNLPAPAAK